VGGQGGRRGGRRERGSRSDLEMGYLLTSDPIPLPSLLPPLSSIRLGGAKDTERLLALFEAMGPLMGIDHTAR